MRSSCLAVLVFAGLFGSIKAGDLGVDGNLTVNSAVGVGSASAPAAQLEVKETGTAASADTFVVKNSAGGTIMKVQDYYDSFLVDLIAAANNNDTVFRFFDNGTSWLGYNRTGYMNFKLGIGKKYPACLLDVAGNTAISGSMFLANIATPPTVSSTGGYLYAQSGTLYAADSRHNNTVLSTHLDPKVIAPAAQTSFSDLKVEYPFSFYHKNPLLGKEQAIDMAKLVAWAEGKMKTELGEEAGRLVYTRDLPTSQCMTLEQHSQSLVNAEVAYILDQLKNMPWIKVPVAADGSVPAEALENVAEVRDVDTVTTVTEKKMDFDAGKIIQVQSVKKVKATVPTGRMRKQFRKGWELRDGELYRKPTLQDIDVETMVADAPQLPQWLLGRLKEANKTNMDVKTLADQVRTKVAEALAQDVQP